MAYETGTATGATDLLDKLRLFAIAQGWTVNRWVSWTSGYELCLQKGSAYFNLRSCQNGSLLVNGSTQSSKYGITLNGSDGYAGGSAWDRQPGYAQRAITPSATDQYHAFLPMVTNFGPFPAYHLFAPDSKTIYLELEISTGVFQRLGFGSLDLYNPSTPGGGRFFYATGAEHVTNATTSSTWLGSEIGSTWSQEEVPFRAAEVPLSAGRSGSAVRCAFDAFNNWAGSGTTSAATNLAQSCQGGGTHDRLIRDLAPNPLNNIGLLTPNVVSVNRANLYLHPIGVVPGMRYMDMTNYLPGDEFTLGSDTWKVFPWYNKGGRSFQRGIAYLKVV